MKQKQKKIHKSKSNKKITPIKKPFIKETDRLYLLVPYEEKDIVYKLGGQWDAVIKCWYCSAKDRTHPKEAFSRWMPNKNTIWEQVAKMEQEKLNNEIIEEPK